VSTPSTEMRRLEARIPASLKELLERAAQLEGRSQTDIIIDALGARTRSIIRDHEVITLSRADQIRFTKSLLDPPEPTTGQKRRAKWFKGELDK
jgi:uncharacterized protein (DUF1778 family)